MTLVDMQNFQLLQILPDTLPVRSTGVRFSESFSLKREKKCFAMSRVCYVSDLLFREIGKWKFTTRNIENTRFNSLIESS